MSGFEAAVRAGPLPEAKLISVGEHPIIALYKLTKVIISFVCLVHYMKMTNLLTQLSVLRGVSFFPVVKGVDLIPIQSLSLMNLNNFSAIN